MVRNILLVDDSRTELLHLCKLLWRNGYRVRTAQNADEAMLELAKQLPDLILMDVVMPGTNGFSLTRNLARHPQYGKVPVFICSSKNLESDRVWGLRQGALDYFTKPVDTQLLLARIQALP
ncbi:MAG: response regulator [Serpentinimonas sp.]|nr:MAG: chemotaxis protein CheY [Comamonadaceae bacterium BICA1-1]MDO8274403.1 response regulator [Serpentinimonas sp.]MDO9610826.1 response regulator [Serpentinimonas sp.]